MPMRVLPSIQEGGSGSGSGSGRYSSSGSNSVGCVRGCCGRPIVKFRSVINSLFYHRRQIVIRWLGGSEILGIREDFLPKGAGVGQYTPNGLLGLPQDRLRTAVNVPRERWR